MTTPYKVSNSELQTFKQCKRKWYFAYYLRLKPRAVKVTGPLALGSRVHEALDQHDTTGINLLEAYSKLLAVDKQIAEDNFLPMDKVESEGELGRIMLEGYQDWAAEEGLDAAFELVSTEEILSMPMYEGAVELQGKLDRRVRRKSDGVRLFSDYKTCVRFGDIEETAQINEQILTYMLLEQAQNKPGEHSSGGLFTLLKKVKRTANAKPPFYRQFEVHHNDFTLRNFWQHVHGVVGDLMRTKNALDQGADHHFVAYPTVTKDCTWKCEFFTVCGMMDDGSDVDRALDDLYEVHDPYDYYADGKTDTPAEEAE